MSAHFSKLETVNLTDEEDSGSEVEGDGQRRGGEEEGYQVKLVLTGGGKRSRGWKERLRRRRGKGRGGGGGSCVNSWRWVFIALVAFSVSIVISLMVAKLSSEPPPVQEDATPTSLKGAVATDAPVCSEMAAEILRRNGSAVDAAITALLCTGAVHPESSGLGGGGFMVVYHPNGSRAAVEFRETAPSAATVDMFHSNSTLSTDGGLSVAVPGELRGMELAHSLYGRLNWSDLFKPVIVLCRTGYNLSLHTEKAIQEFESVVMGNQEFQEMYTINGSLKKEGDLVRCERLATTLELVASQGADAFYTGTIADNIIKAVNASGGILTPDDLRSYRATLSEPVHTEYNGYTLYTTPPPSGGVELLFPLNIMSDYTQQNSSSSPTNLDQSLMYHRLVEAFKYMFALRSQLGDPECWDCDGEAVREVQNNMTSKEYAAIIRALISDTQTYNASHYHAHYATPPEDHGTTHISVLSPDGMAVSVTSSINTYFGSKLITEDGIVLNNDMDDFSSPNITNHFGVKPSEANFISPGKRALSSICPVIAVKTSGSGETTEYLIAGASGGTRIPTSTAQVLLRVLSLSESLSSAIEARRLHHQLTPNQVYTEANFSSEIISFLESRGHEVTATSSYAVVQGVHVNEGGVVSAHSDSRKQGQAVVLQ